MLVEHKLIRFRVRVRPPLPTDMLVEHRLIRVRPPLPTDIVNITAADAVMAAAKGVEKGASVTRNGKGEMGKGQGVEAVHSALLKSHLLKPQRPQSGGPSGCEPNPNPNPNPNQSGGPSGREGCRSTHGSSVRAVA